jgi:hypothetical protein
MATTTTTHPLIETIGRALSSGDRNALAELYAPDSLYVSAGGSHPPAEPLRLEGEAVGEYLRGIPQEVQMSLEDHLIGNDGRIVFHTVCRFPAGGRAISAHLVTLDGAGRIARHESVESVDE